ncbi:hypothetical protein EXIGLDRAFT_845013 [Exidia glandulosa HHB12029]|uniref:Uncharacterized protein n=1 Tax=Exidia glandulosa HHB12029 TaxID=1314781 RepID=A0A165BQ64_EXIGL|nr:hypothetical protein EXIGLDRAFT_845013 [Exidia glandulosa HHB12029]
MPSITSEPQLCAQVGVDEDGIPLVAHPSEDIQSDLRDALTSDLEFRGTFAFSTMHADAPNPDLQVDGLGAVGLPLGDFMAGGFKSVCVDRANGQTNIWELEAAHVHCDNKLWDKWIQNVRKTVCTELGVGPARQVVRVILNKLVLCGPGARPFDVLKSKPSPGAFASMLVLLPSRFRGGTAKATFQERTVDISLNGKSASKTIVVAAYTDAELQSDKITSGYSFALLYEFIQPPDSGFPPILPATEPVALALIRHVLLSWKQQEDVWPEKLVWMLDGYYEHIRGRKAHKCLRGKDAVILRVLDRVAREIGIRLGLTQLSHTVEGDIKGSGYGGRWEESEDDYETAEMVKGGEFEDGRKTNLSKLFDLDGRIIRDSVDWDEEDHEVLPLGCDEEFEPGDKKECSRDAASFNYEYIEYTYERTAIVIWPTTSSFNVESGA